MYQKVREIKKQFYVIINTQSRLSRRTQGTKIAGIDQIVLAPDILYGSITRSTDPQDEADLTYPSQRTNSLHRSL
jgi:hypothetical protein